MGLSTRPSGQVGCQAAAVVMATWVLPLSASRIRALKVRSFKDQSLRNARQHRRQLLVVLEVLWRSVSNRALVMRVGTKLVRRSVIDVAQKRWLFEGRRNM